MRSSSSRWVVVAVLIAIIAMIAAPPRHMEKSPPHFIAFAAAPSASSCAVAAPASPAVLRVALHERGYTHSMRIPAPSPRDSMQVTGVSALAPWRDSLEAGIQPKRMASSIDVDSSSTARLAILNRSDRVTVSWYPRIT